ncbi:D-alanyl-D-alanine carboxypeptidase/D-alanyl-D-alanine endopeptidase [Peribacillus glennii]|uniref:D-alanyl-D-alanine carboxypeptidase/D-alanyl-D-alanine endopeptidase n=1 Tax=Peribacillus glennii TaxID=2303991 RepID=UPI001F221723|nr:D-alanyl-D-alanine carboxypeptidase/D-alanyl-D-alanine-endopeptidase [Peribacillus glennii]
MQTLIIILMIPILSIGLALSNYSSGDIVQAQVSGGPYSFANLSKILKHPLLDGSVTGISVRSAESGEILFEQNGNIRLRPASNFKLLTAAAAMESLGKDHTFKTELLTNGRIRANVLTGNLYMKGYGDPTLLVKDFEEMALALKKTGVKIILGNVLGDDSWFDGERYSKDLPWSDETEYYGAQISALTAAPDAYYDAGTVIVEVGSGKKVNQPAAISLTPATDYVKIINSVKTVGYGGKKKIKVHRVHGTNTIKAEGTIPLGESTAKSRVAVWEPAGYALELFTNALQKQRIKVAGRVRKGRTPKNAAVLVSRESMTLSQLLVPFMKLSNNGHAETLVKEMGKVEMGEGSWEKGLKAVETNLKSLGTDTDNIVIRDGSGISHVNLIPANEITKLLFTIQKKAWFPAYEESLPVAGASKRMLGGTLKNRMRSSAAAGNVKAKTGTISTVSALSGYVTGKSGQTYIFSILINNVCDAAAVKIVEDQIAEFLSNQ